MPLNRQHFIQRQTERAIARQCEQSLSVQAFEHDFCTFVALIAAGRTQANGFGGIDDGFFNRLIRQSFPRQDFEITVAATSHLNASTDTHQRQGDAEIGRALDDRGFDRVHDASFALHLNDAAFT